MQPLALIVRLLVVRVEASSFTDQAASTRCSNSRCHWHAGVLMAASGGHPLPTQSASTRSYSGRWSDIRQWAILGLSHRHGGLATRLPVARGGVSDPPV